MTDTQLAAQQLAHAIARLRLIERDLRTGVPVTQRRVVDARRDVEHYRGVYAAVLAIAGTAVAA